MWRAAVRNRRWTVVLHVNPPPRPARSLGVLDVPVSISKSIALASCQSSILLSRMAGFEILWSRVPCMGRLVSGMLHLFGFLLDYDEHDFGTDLDSGEFAGELWRVVSLCDR
jgi:hypothetical protein